MSVPWQHFHASGRQTAESAPRSLLTVSRLREVHISISEGAPGDHVAADPDGEHRSGWAEFLVQHRLRDVGVQIANVERSHRIAPRRCVHIAAVSTGGARLEQRQRNAGSGCDPDPNC